MNKVLKKMTIVYKEGVYCIFHIDEQFMTILQLKLIVKEKQTFYILKMHVKI